MLRHRTVEIYALPGRSVKRMEKRRFPQISKDGFPNAKRKELRGKGFLKKKTEGFFRINIPGISSEGGGE